ncbi:MAG: M81 family metallopeptidase [Fimbriimonas sp.]|nr:M81 family metallopeptidase [Fimbriimonas sp.]
MRIAVAGIGHETNTFSSLRTTLSDFWVRRGEECVPREIAEEFGAEVELAPCLIASATPNGMVTLSAYTELRDELLARLKLRMPFDGIYLSLHGAMEVEEIGDGETDLLRSIRRLVGPNMPIAASLDLHGNLSPEFVASVNILTALRTAPHIDGPETRVRAFRHLVQSIRQGVRLTTAMKKLPLLLPGENAVTATEPSKSLYAHISELESNEGIWDASLMIACAWTDSPHTSVSTLVVGEDGERASTLACEYGDLVWTKRHEFGPEVATIPLREAIARAMAATEGPVFVSDSGDNVTAGGAGDVSFMLGKLLTAGAKDVLYAGITDPAAVEACVAVGPGETVELSLGGKLDAINCQPLGITAKVLRVEGGTATVEVDDITVVITDGRRPFHTLESFEPSGIDPLSKRIVVVKQGYLAPELRERCSETFIALTPGFTDLRIACLPYRNLSRPIYPLDPI